MAVSRSVDCGRCNRRWKEKMCFGVVLGVWTVEVEGVMEVGSSELPAASLSSTPVMPMSVTCYHLLPPGKSPAATWKITCYHLEKQHKSFIFCFLWKIQLPAWLRLGRSHKAGNIRNETFQTPGSKKMQNYAFNMCYCLNKNILVLAPQNGDLKNLSTQRFPTQTHPIHL